MWRVILILAAALVVADTTGLMPEGDCSACTDEADGKQCPPTCPTCTCVWHSLRTAPTTRIELKTVELTPRTVELPPPSEAHGLLAPAPKTRPPIV